MKTALSLTLLALFALPVPALAQSRVATFELERRGPYAVHTEERTWFDARRRRPVPIRLQVPQASAGALPPSAQPLIIFSHSWRKWDAAAKASKKKASKKKASKKKASKKKATRKKATKTRKRAVQHLRAHAEGLTNLVSLVCKTDDPSIPEPVDLVFVCDTYHHIGDRVEYFSRLKKDLRPGGRLAIVDFKKGDFPVGPKDPSKLAPEKVIAELAEAGYRLVKQDNDLPYQYVLVLEPL